MRLSIGGEREIVNPSAFEIEQAIRSLDPDADAFVILEADDRSYAQAALNADGSFVLEYQEGSVEEHFGAVGKVTAESVTAALQAYARGEATWKAGFAWERLRL